MSEPLEWQRPVSVAMMPQEVVMKTIQREGRTFLMMRFEGSLVRSDCQYSGVTMRSGRREEILDVIGYILWPTRGRQVGTVVETYSERMYVTKSKLTAV